MKMRVDQGNTFISVRWTRLSDAVGTFVQTYVVESHNSLGFDERYQSPLRKVPKMGR